MGLFIPLPFSNSSTQGGPNMEQQRILLINFKTELARLAADILEGNNFEVTNVESLEKITKIRPKNFLRNPDRLFKLQSLL